MFVPFVRALKPGVPLHAYLTLGSGLTESKFFMVPSVDSPAWEGRTSTDIDVMIWRRILYWVASRPGQLVLAGVPTEESGSDVLSELIFE